MNNDLQADISVRLGQTLTHISRLEEKIGKVDSAIRRANRSGRDSQRQIGRSMEQAGVATGGAQQKLKAWSEALTRAGGPVGELAGRVGGGAGLAGGMGKAAIAIALVSTALRVLDAASARRIQRVRELIGAERELANARRAGIQAEGAQATAGLSQEGELRLLYSRGGPGAVQLADQIAQSGIGGSEARRGVASALTIADPRARAVALSAAQALARTGEMGFAAAVDQVAGNRALQRRFAGMQGDVGVDARSISDNAAAAAGLVLGQTGRSMSGRQVQDAYMRAGFSGYLGQASAVRGVTAQTEVAQRGLVERGAAMAPAMQALWQAQDPIGEALRALQQQQAIAISQLERMERVEGGLTRWTRDMGMWLGGEGSAHQQRLRQQRAYQEAE